MLPVEGLTYFQTIILAAHQYLFLKVIFIFFPNYFSKLKLDFYSNLYQPK